MKRRKIELHEVCGRCGRQYGEHSAVGSRCPLKLMYPAFGTRTFRRKSSGVTTPNTANK